MDSEQVRNAYSAIADLYIERFGSPQLVPAEDLAFIGRQLSVRSGPVFDLGCGPGHLTDYLRSLGVDATGIDMVPGFIAHAQAAYPDGTYRLGSLRELDVEEHTVAGILAWYSLIHLPPEELDDVLSGFRRALAPGAKLVVGVVDGDELSAFDHTVVTAYRWPAEEFSARLARAGFTEVEREQRQAGEGQPRPHAAIAFTGPGLTTRTSGS